MTGHVGAFELPNIPLFENRRRRPVLLIDGGFLEIEFVSEQAVPPLAEPFSRHAGASEEFVEARHSSPPIFLPVLRARVSRRRLRQSTCCATPFPRGVRMP